MDKDRRAKKEPVPDNLEEILTPLQLMTIRRVEDFGGQLWFVRRPLFQTVVPVVKCSHTTDGDPAIVDEDGTLIKDHGLIFRDD